jgi:hypothetical protein
VALAQYKVPPSRAGGQSLPTRPSDDYCRDLLPCPLAPLAGGRCLGGPSSPGNTARVPRQIVHCFCSASRQHPQRLHFQMSTSSFLNVSTPLTILNIALTYFPFWLFAAIENKGDVGLCRVSS